VANASVDKIKALGLRHGEKAVMALTALLCLFCLYTAVSQETIDLTPDQVKGAADQAQQNINRKQEPNDILKVLVDQGGIKLDAGFEKSVEQQKDNVLVAANFRPPQLWAAPEPGAGLIRDQPELIAPSELYAYPGRGGALVYELDDAGNRVPDPDAGKPMDLATQERRQRRSGGMSAGAARRKMDETRKKAEEEKKRELEAARLKSALAGKGEPKKEEALAATTGVEPRMKEKTQGIRWVAITGVLNYKELRDSYLRALKQPDQAYPHFKQLDIERQVKQLDGSWGDWEAVDQSRNMQILDNLPEEDEEWTPETVRISALVAPLPYLKAGFWERVHVARMVPAEKLKVAETPIGGYAGPGFEAPIGSSAPQPMPQPMEAPPMVTSGSAGMAMLGGYGGGGTGESVDFEKRDVEEIMIRALDLTVEPDTTYRFRVRVVVYNPNLGREDISPGVDTKSVEIFGPWSDPTEEVTMPPDVATYALNKEPPVPRKLDQVNFEVARWTPDNGVTVVKRFPAAPGEIIGDYSTAAVPITNLETGRKEPKPQRVDFNSHQVVLDVMGGDQPIPPLGPGAVGRLSVPAVALVVRRDGAVVIRSQASDVHDQVRRDMADNFARELKAAEEEKKKNRPGSAPGSAVPMP
jgi:hypothetical protein